MAAEVKSSAPVSAAERKEEGSPFAETMPADSNFLATQTPKRLQAMERQLELERDVKAELQAQLKEEEQYRRRIEAERDREKAMRQAAESQASIWQETGKKMRRDLERLLTQEEQRRRDVEMDRDKAHNQRRAAEVDMTVARQQLLAEVQLRREAEQKLSKSNFVKEEEWGASFQDTMFKIVRTLPQLFEYFPEC
mmetsp:Transcript_71727/g.120211  ORF Transcript_71727/g.120211 Transcript_71727/m.120211 type:complete len:195 (+) Transcript_71727:100-684(+)